MGKTDFQSRGGPIGPLRRFAAITFLVWPVLGLYMVICHRQTTAPTVVTMPPWVPFWPAAFAPYVGLLLATWLLPVAIRDAGRFRACLWADVCAYLLVIPWWILMPTTLPRPPAPEGAWTYAYQWLWALDPPNNVMPCAHGIGPMVAAWFVGRDRPKWRWLLAGMLGLGLPAIVLSWQHRPMDVFLGAVAAVVGIAVGEALIRRNRPQEFE